MFAQMASNNKMNAAMNTLANVVAKRSRRSSNIFCRADGGEDDGGSRSVNLPSSQGWLATVAPPEGQLNAQNCPLTGFSRVGGFGGTGAESRSADFPGPLALLQRCRLRSRSTGRRGILSDF